MICIKTKIKITEEDSNPLLMMIMNKKKPPDISQEQKKLFNHEIDLDKNKTRNHNGIMTSLISMSYITI